MGFLGCVTFTLGHTKPKDSKGTPSAMRPISGESCGPATWVFDRVCSEQYIERPEETRYRGPKSFVDVMSCICDNELFLSGYKYTDDQLTDAGIRTVLNITRSVKLHRRPYPECVEATRKYGIRDSLKEDMLKHMDNIVGFMEDAEKPILVHCVAGVSRSATVVMCYLIKTRGFSLKEVFRYVLERRPCVRPNAAFLEQIFLYECGVRKA